MWTRGMLGLGASMVIKSMWREERGRSGGLCSGCSNCKDYGAFGVQVALVWV
jgi:hypothetical protein